MKFSAVVYGCIALLMFCMKPLAAQNAQPVPIKPHTATSGQAATSAEIAAADLSVTANISTRELRFDQVGQLKIEFFGAPQQKTLWEEERQNIARPAQPGTTYRDISSQLRITSRFAEIERIVAQALGQIAANRAPLSSNAASPARVGIAFPVIPAPRAPLPIEAAPISTPKSVLPVKPLPARNVRER